MKTNSAPYFRAVIKEELAARIAKNSRYSLRAFAGALGLEPSALSKILSGKRFLSEKMAARFFKILDLTPEEQHRFLLSLVSAKKKQGVGRISSSLRKLGEAPSVESQKDLTLENFRVIADWYHYAILELTYVRGFKSDPRWIANQLKIGESECRLAIDRLLQLELLVEHDGKIQKAEFRLDTFDKTKTSAAHRLRQKQILKKSIESLENDPIEVRNHSAVTVPIDPTKIPEAKRRIAEFLWSLSDFLSSEDKKQVYELTVNLFPLSIPSKESV